MIIDTHVHLYGKGLTPPGRVSLVSAALEVIDSSFDRQVEFYLNMMNDAGVDKSVVFATPPETAIEIIKPHLDRFIPFANVDALSGRASELLNYYVTSLGYRGVYEFLPAASHFYPDDFDLLDQFYRKAIDLDVPIAWHLHDSFLFGASRIHFGGNERLQEVCFKYPQLRHILCHVGGFEKFRESLHAFSGYENVYFDLSGICFANFPLCMKPEWKSKYPIRHLPYVYPERMKDLPQDYQEVIAKVRAATIEVYREAANLLPNRIMFATDAPLGSSMQNELEICRKAFEHDSVLLEHVLGENAKKFLKI
jgi:predicted TIM-barrel fold metal-dependent hydrolase